MKPHHVTLCLLAILSLPDTGCVLPFGPNDIRTEVSRQAHVRLKPTITVSTDGLTLTAVGGLLHIPLPVWHIGWVAIGVYEIESAGGTWSSAQFAMLQLPGWERFVHTRDGDTASLVFSRADDESLRSMVVLSKQGDELIVVKLYGRLDKLMQGVPGISSLAGLFVATADGSLDDT